MTWILIIKAKWKPSQNSDEFPKLRGTLISKIRTELISPQISGRIGEISVRRKIKIQAGIVQVKKPEISNEF